MNFFGHAVIASWMRPEPPFVLGSMLPDFEGMVRQRISHINDSVVSAGIDFHHRTDAVFHRAPTFIALCRHALRELQGAGVRRGTARAVAHLGTELFLDGWLANGNDGTPMYRASLTETEGAVDWHDGGEAFTELRRRLIDWGPPHAYREPTFVMERLAVMLDHRDRLRIEEEDHAQVQRFLLTLRPTVEAAAPELLAHLKNGLGCQHE